MKRVIVSDPCDEVEHIEQIVYGMENLHLICEGVYYGQNLTRPITKSVKKEVILIGLLVFCGTVDIQ